MAQPGLDKVTIPQPWGEAEAHFKERLKAAGHWRRFLVDRAVYRLRGLPAAVAHRLAQQHFPPPGFPVGEIDTGVQADSIGLSHRMTGEEVRGAMLDRLGLRAARTTDFAEDKRCSPAESMEWVAEYLGFDVTRHDAPSKLAWSLYVWAKPSPANTRRFYGIYLASLLPRAKAAADEGVDPFAGISAEYEDVGLPGGERNGPASAIPAASGAGHDR